MDEERKYAVELNLDCRDIDSVEIKIPAGYEAESTPVDMKIESKFGKYVTSTHVMTDKILYVRLHERYSGKFPAKEYFELAKYYEQIYKADCSKVVLIKKG